MNELVGGAYTTSFFVMVVSAIKMFSGGSFIWAFLLIFNVLIMLFIGIVTGVF